MCDCERESIDCLEYKISRTGISSIIIKAQGISSRFRPKNLKQLRSFLGAVNQFNKFIPNLAAISYPFRSNLRKDADWCWSKGHEEAFLKMNQEISITAVLSHLNETKGSE